MKKSLVKFIILFTVFLSSIVWADDWEDISKLSVKGEASLFKPADQMEVALGVLTSAESSSIALNENNQRIHQIMENLKGLGLDENDYQTGRFHIRPIYKKPLKDEEEDQKEIIRYEVLNHVKIRTKRIELADKIVMEAIRGGANQIDTVNFNIENTQSYREEAIRLAMQSVFSDGSTLAHAAGVKLGRILSISLDHWQQAPKPFMLAKQPSVYQIDQQIIEPGQVEIRVIINVIFEIF